MPYFNEHALEMAIMELFQQEDYLYTNGEQVHKEVNDVLLRDDLRMYLRSRYEDITTLEVESAIVRLTARVGFSDYENNVANYRLITEGFSLKREDASQPDLFVEPIDFTTESNNIFRIVNQLEILGREKRIPDGIVYINFGFFPEYFMDDSVADYYEAPSPNLFMVYNDSTEDVLHITSEEEDILQYGVKLISYEYADPIENSFKEKLTFSRFEPSIN